MLMGCGENVDFVPRNNPHFVGPTIVQQHRNMIACNVEVSAQPFEVRRTAITHAIT